MASRRRANLLHILLLALLCVAPPTTGAAAPRDIVSGAEGKPHGASPASFQPYPSAAYDDPGAPYGYPHRDTFGYTVESLNESRWFDFDANDSTGANVIVEMGGFNRMHMTDLQTHYWADVAFDARIRMWDDGDGYYEPNNSRSNGSASAGGPGRAICASVAQVCIGPDDPCPAGDFPLMDVYVGTTPTPTSQDVFLRTVYGGDVTGCSGPNASEEHAFTILPDPHRPGDPAGRFHIPKWVLGSGSMPARECFVRLRFVPRDLELPHHSASHDPAQHGVSINVTSVMVQLVAPPTVINHGYSAAINPSTQILPNQIQLQHNLRQAMRQNFGQDPWEWASLLPFQGIYLNSYDRKQDFRVSAQELADKVAAEYKSHWTGKIWLHGQSMGGLVTRYYVEQLGGHAHVEKLAQTASPNTGSFEPMIYTYLFQFFYAIEDNAPVNRHLLWWPVPPCPIVVSGYPPVWKPWATSPPGNVWTYHCGFPHGRSRMADFELRPAGPILNPIVSSMNSNYLASPGYFPPYFSVRAQIAATPGFDGAVAFASASLNGAIPTRTIKAFHEDVPSQPQTAVYFSRFFGSLDLDTAYPKWCMPHETRAPHVIVDPANPGDLLDPHAGPDHAGNATENATLEMHLSTKGVVPFDNSSDAPTGPVGEGARPVLNDRVRIPLDALGPVRISVHTPLDLPPLDLSVAGPDGGAVRAEQRMDTHGWTRVQEVLMERPGRGEHWLSVGPTVHATPYVLLASWPSARTLSLGTDASSHPGGAPLALRAWLTGVDADAVVEVTARVPTRSGVADLRMTGANGTYSAEWTPPDEAGAYAIGVTAEGFTPRATPSGAAKTDVFLRKATLHVLVEAKPPATEPPRAVTPTATMGDAPDAKAASPAPAAAPTPASQSRPSATPTTTPDAPAAGEEAPTPGPTVASLVAAALLVAHVIGRRRAT